MAISDPVLGLVVRYSYLWEREARQGHEEGGKGGRPCVVILAARREKDGALRVAVVPITHTPPEEGSGAVEVPPKVGAHLGFDAAKSWIVTSEVNLFTWPGPDLRPLRSGEFAYGHLPYRLANQVKDSVLERNREQLKKVERDEPAPSRIALGHTRARKKASRITDKDRDWER